MKPKHPLTPKVTWNQWSVGAAWMPLWTLGHPARRYREVYVFFGPLIWSVPLGRSKQGLRG